MLNIMANKSLDDWNDGVCPTMRQARSPGRCVITAQSRQGSLNQQNTKVDE